MNRILENIKRDFYAQTNSTNFTNNNDNVNAIKADFLQKYPDINFDVYYNIKLVKSKLPILYKNKKLRGIY